MLDQTCCIFCINAQAFRQQVTTLGSRLTRALLSETPSITSPWSQFMIRCPRSTYTVIIKTFYFLKTNNSHKNVSEGLKDAWRFTQGETWWRLSRTRGGQLERRTTSRRSGATPGRNDLGRNDVRVRWDPGAGGSLPQLREQRRRPKIL